MASTSGDTTSTAPKSLPMTPSALLWNFELQREKRAFMQHLMHAKFQLDETELLVKQLTSCLKDLTVIVASVATSLDDQTPQGQQRLRLLRTQLHEIVDPLYKNAKVIVGRNEVLLAAIAKLRGLHNTAILDKPANQIPPPGLEPVPAKKSSKRISNPIPNPTPEREDASSPLTHALLKITHSRSNSNQANEKDLTGPVNPTHPAKSMQQGDFNTQLDSVMKQNGRAIGEYFDAAHDFRREALGTRAGLGKDHTIIEAFLEGLDRNLYRRRFTHWLRKEHWTWNFVFHYAQILIMEEEYMAKQEYAMEHKLEDGSVLFPDGERSYRFSYLPPITDEDLTASDTDY